MLMKNECNKLVKYGIKMEKYGLTEGTTGNLSIYDPYNDTIAITPSGISYGRTKPEDIVVMDLNGNILQGTKKPSSEYQLHAEIYKNKPLAKSVVHTHSTYCTVLACTNTPIEAVHYTLADAGTEIIPVAQYATYGTLELAQNAVNAIGNGKAVLLANHGMLSYGESIKEAFSIAKTCEWTAKIQYKAMCIGKPIVLSAEEMAVVIKKFQTYGQVALDFKEAKK